MSYTIESAFDIYYQRINLSTDYRALAATRRDHIISMLGRKLNVITAFANGSITKFTALSNHADLDIFVVLHFGAHCSGKSPADVLMLVRDALENKPSVRRNGQAVTLKYDSFPNVDVVPIFFTSHDGRRYEDSQYLSVPDMNTGKWIRSTPEEHSKLIDASASVRGANFRRIIKMLKHWNWKHGNVLSSYHIEVLALKHLPTSLTDLPWDIYQFFQSMTTSMDVRLFHQHSYVDEYLSTAQRADAVNRLSTACGLAREAWLHGFTNQVELSINSWHRLFGEQFPTYG